MAASKSYFSRAGRRFFPTERDAPATSDSAFELEESDVWNGACSTSPEFRKLAPGSRTSKKSSVKRVAPAELVGGNPSSMPVNIPDWSKILKDQYVENRRSDGDGDADDDNNEDNRIPPHELLARTRMVSFSVHEGIGRTLKGRDLSRVRNAIWEKTGFQD